MLNLYGKKFRWTQALLYHILSCRQWQWPYQAGLVGTTTLAASVGALVGARLMKKVKMVTVQWIVGVMLIFLAISLGAGLI